ncbi:MAG: putative OPT family oligopeptide transporter [Pseudohongiellaceae bacterium]|jgi:putative OPT family oligopeptide transporter
MADHDSSSQQATGGQAPDDKGGTAAGLIVGLAVSSVLSAALVYSAAKAGITPGVSPLVVLFGWVAFGAAMGPRLKRFLAIGQVTGSAGAAVTAGVVFTAPIVQILYREMGLEVPGVDVPVLITASLSGALLGFGFVGLATKRFLTDPRLPAPEAVACERLIETAVENPEARPRLSTSLVPALLTGLGVNALLQLKWLQEMVHTLAFKIPFLTGPASTAADGTLADSAAATPVNVELPLPISPLYIGIGALLTLPTALLMFGGGIVNSITTGYAAANAMPGTTFRWVGGAAMTVAVLYSLLSYVLEGRSKGSGDGEADEDLGYDESLLEIPRGSRMLLLGSLALGSVLLLVMMAMVGADTKSLLIIGAVALVLVSLLSGLGGLLSLQVGSSASPVSGTVFVAMLVLSLTALAIGLTGIAGIVLLVPIVVAACVAICAANDSSQDYKTMQLNGMAVKDGFVGQLLGLLAGAVVVPLTLWLAHEANIESGGVGLGDAALPAPQASFFATVLQSLFLEGETPWGPVKVGALLGLLAVGLERFGKSRGLILSSLAFAVGIYLPSYIGTGILIGALARYVATFKISASTHSGILTAAGLITGDAFASLILGIAIIAGAPIADWEPVGGHEAGLSNMVGVGVMLVLVLVVLLNYLKPRRTR